MDSESKETDVAEAFGVEDAGARAGKAEMAADARETSSTRAKANASEGSPTRPSAIDRQRAAVAAALRAERRPQPQESQPRVRFTDDYEDDEERRFPTGIVAMSALLLAVGGALFSPELRQSLQDRYQAAVHSGQDFVASSQTPDTAARVAAPAPAPAANARRAVEPAEPERATLQSTSASPPEKVAPVETPQPVALSIPLENISMRDGPELFEQLVGIYRTQVASDPANMAARDALGRLRDKSLAELDAAIVQSDAAGAVTSLETVSRLFPELTQSPRYQSQAAAVNKMQRDTARENPAPAAGTENKVANTNAAPAPAAVAPAAAPATPVPANTDAANTAAANPPAVNPPAVNQRDTPPVASDAEKPREKAVPMKPDVRILAATPGRVEAGRFIPAQGGKTFLLVLNYRNFADRLQQSDAELEIRLGNTGDRQVLAEATVEVDGDRGTTSIPMETFVQGYAGEAYKLNFFLDGQFLAARTIRLAAP